MENTVIMHIVKDVHNAGSIEFNDAQWEDSFTNNKRKKGNPETILAVKGNFIKWLGNFIEADDRRVTKSFKNGFL